MKTFLTIFSMITVPCGSLSASGPDKIAWEFSAVSLRTEHAGYSFVLAVGAEGELAQLTMVHNKVTRDFAKVGFSGINRPILRRIELTTRNAVGFGPENNICLTIPYNRVNIDKDNRILAVVDVVQFFFFQGSLKSVKKCTAIQGSPGKWRFTEYDANNGRQIGAPFEESDKTNNPLASFDFSRGEK